MKLILSIVAGSALVLSACAQVEAVPGDCDIEVPEIVAYAKDGTPIYSEVLGLTVFAPPSRDVGGSPPSDCPTPPCDPIDPDDPVTDPDDPAYDGKCNCGTGNDSEGDPDCDPGNSGDHNQAGD